jgi:hypothetical protein
LIRFLFHYQDTLTHLLLASTCLWCSRPSISTLPITQIVKKLVASYYRRAPKKCQPK